MLFTSKNFVFSNFTPENGGGGARGMGGGGEGYGGHFKGRTPPSVYGPGYKNSESSAEMFKIQNAFSGTTLTDSIFQAPA